MLNNNRDKILMMHPVRINFKLNKFKLEENRNYSINAINDSLDGYMQGGNQKVWDGIPFSVKKEYKNKTLIKVAEMWLKTRLLFVEKPSGSPSDFFECVKSSLSETEIKEFDSNNFNSLIKKLDITKQDFEKNKLLSDRRVVEYESIIKNAGFNKSISEEDLISFIKNTRKGLCLEELQYFHYDIPQSVVENIDKAEKLNVFDNYYIFHFDPNAKANIFYEKEKDPIVFGVIQNSNKLYFIDDWISDYCNLQFDMLASN